ncbi:hypothetical protein C0J52_15605 [Blattella germanica]|nr:hypothetical protein C0J52_15605 [Blattella germanica]
MVQMSSGTKERLSLVVGASKFMFHWGFIPTILYLGYKKGADAGMPPLSIMKCPRNEYCCNFGCCVSPAFQFYQLWYYCYRELRLLVIFMFLLCSGGGWWYRYWLQSRYRTCPGSILPVTNSNSRQSRVATRNTNTQPRRHSRPRVARVSYNPSRDAVVLHRIWKGTRNCPPPSYSSAQAELSTSASNQSSPYHNMLSHPPMTPGPNTLFPTGHIPHPSTGINGQECPYYQLYGPPPSYDSVMSEVGESSRQVVSPVRQTNAVNSNGSFTQETSPGVSATISTHDTVENNVMPSQETVSAIASLSHHDENSPSEGMSDELSNAADDVHNVQAAQSINVQSQHSDTSNQTARGGDTKSFST